MDGKAFAQRAPRVLLIEDGHAAARVAADCIRREGLSFVRERSALGARCAFRPGGFCLAVVDLGLPRSETDPRDADGFDVVAFLRSRDPALPVIVWTASVDPAKTERALTLDVEILDKADADGLRRAIRRAAERLGR